MISSIYNNENTIPVNRLAASMLYKTPEWQEVPKKVRLAVMEIQLPDAVINIDFFKKPQSRMPKEIPIPDRRGQVFEFVSGKVIVTGYADNKVKSKPIAQKNVMKPADWVGNNFDPSKIKRRTNTLHFWWAMYLKDGSFVRIKSETINKWQRKSTGPNAMLRGVAPDTEL